jgi:hypothetical protein
VDVGGLGLVVRDVFPPVIRTREPSGRRVSDELRHLKRQGLAGRTKVLLQLAYWPKLLEAVLLQEKRDLMLEQKRKKTQEVRAANRRARLQTDGTPGPAPALPALPESSADAVAPAAAAASGPLVAAAAAPVPSPDSESDGEWVQLSDEDDDSSSLEMEVSAVSAADRGPGQ